MLMDGYSVEGSSSESEREEEEEEEAPSSSKDALVMVDEDEDFGLPEMVIFVHERIYRDCKEVGMCEDYMHSMSLLKCLNQSRAECLEREWCWKCDGSVRDGSGEDDEGFGSGIVSYDERMNVHKKVILVRDVEV